MDIIFITRCYKPNNLQKIKQNIKKIFSAQTEHDYIQYLLVDLSYNQPIKSFESFEDEHTRVVFTQDKKDYYNCYGIDQLIKSVQGDQNTWVYILDDDNLLTDNFLDIFKDYQNEDVLVLDNNQFSFSRLPIIGNVISRIDVSNYIVKLRILIETSFYMEGRKSYESDGMFFQNILRKQYKFKCTRVYTTIKSALNRPLNILRKDL